MSKIAKLMQQAAAGSGGELLAIEDVFSTYLYTGNDSIKTITNGIDLAGEGGLVWVKSRGFTLGGTTGISGSHMLVDTERGSGFRLFSNTTDGNISASGWFSAFNSDGFAVGANMSNGFNGGEAYASWTFRKAPRFFDVVTYTGTGSARTVSHNLGTTVGSIIIKRTDTSSNWAVYHRGNTAAPETDFLSLNLENATADDATYWNDTAPTNSVFTVGTNAAVNASGGTYVAYLFAHDPLGPSGDGSDGLIACGSFTGNGSTNGPEINLGWEPQWLLIKNANGPYLWPMFDNMRGLTVTTDSVLRANASNAELTNVGDVYNPTATGFKVTAPGPVYNESGSTHIYIAIRRGPMRPPESGSEVFGAILANNATGTKNTTGFPVDAQIMAEPAAVHNTHMVDRLRGVNTTSTEVNFPASRTHESSPEYSFALTRSWDNTGFLTASSNNNQGMIYWNFRRAPGFFDVVAYTGTGVARTVPHNLGVAPELMIVKKRSAVDNWVVYAGDATDYLTLNSTAATADLNTMWNDTAPTSSVFSLGTNDDVNGNTATFIAYLFASLAGVSKVGSYTGNGSSQTINCGFTTGARFVLIKRTDSTGDWYVWDTARGIVAGNDPHLSLNTTAAEVTTNDSLDPDSSGFIVNQVAATNINVNAASYIYLAIA